MFAKELKEKIAEIPDDALIYLDDHAMPTPMGLAEITTQTGNIFAVDVDLKYIINDFGEILPSPEKIVIVTLATYKTPEGGWQNDQFATNSQTGRVGTTSKSKKKKSKKKSRR